MKPTELPHFPRLALAIATLWTVWILLTHLGLPNHDLASLYFGAYFFASGDHSEIYAASRPFFISPPPESWAEAGDAAGFKGHTLYPYVYPPLWAAVFAPFVESITPNTFFKLAYFVQVPMIAGAIYLAHRVTLPSLPLFISMFLGMAVVWHTMIGGQALIHNQPQIFVSFLIVLTIERLEAGKQRQAGMALALAASIKLYPVFLVLLFALGKRWQALWTFLLAGTLLGLLSLLLAGIPLHFEFIDRLRSISEVVIAGKFNLNIENLLWPLFDANTNSFEEPVALTFVNRVVLVLGLAYLVHRYRQDDPLWQRLGFPLSLLTLVSLAGPVAWTHQYLTQLYFLPALLLLWPARIGVVLILAFAFVMSQALHGHLYNSGPIKPETAQTLAVIGLFFAYALAPRRTV